ncbi:hypothetical protein BEI02_00425 [Elizabethkingia sp. HvH-WGS333]|uniref:hypothetical protein n=2 Tax=Elizabethkingia TaxID=308865 RepID=UPI00074178D4|nr:MULTISPECIES: hypothetical protein [Elizabethkingia]KUG11518.1 hypothetical protein AMC91_13835 [Elizabethkingia miricola]KUY31364.1 hypothetical protein ATB96_10775 [Elizabethkingia ursingii]MCL1657625.1 hypothetical protein [Elizabethkingia miricola]MCP1250300.1 hypothetical protein [Elizabethkingia sp. S0634]OIK48358.1 hypothetical protein BEI02_00425 [Elizabethkingia sp. HvH-WGS333]
MKNFKLIAFFALLISAMNFAKANEIEPKSKKETVTPSETAFFEKNEKTLKPFVIQKIKLKKVSFQKMKKEKGPSPMSDCIIETAVGLVIYGGMEGEDAGAIATILCSNILTF